MKTIRCSQCKKEKEVSDEWTFKTCPICRAKNLEKRDLEKRAKEARQGLDVKKHPFIETYAMFRKAFKKLKGHEATFEQYLTICEDMRRRETTEALRRTFKEQKIEREESKLINSLTFPLINEDCKTYRLLRAKSQRSPEEDEFIGTHILKCQTCTNWLKWFKELEPEEGDDSAFEKPNIGANPFDVGQKTEPDSGNYKPIDRDVERSELDDSKTDFRKIKDRKDE